MARFRDDEEDYGYGRPEDEVGGYQPYFEQPAPEAPPPEADAAIEALTGGGDSLYDPGPGPALDALLGGGSPDYGEPIGIPTPEWEDTDGPNTDKFNPDRLAGLPSFGESDDEGRWHAMGSGAGRNDQYGLPEEYNILDPGALGGSPNDPGQATHTPDLPPPPPGYRYYSGPQVEGPGTGSDAPTYVPENPLSGLPPLDRNGQPHVPRNKVTQPGGPKDPSQERITYPEDPNKGKSFEEIWQGLFGVPYGQFPPGYSNPLGLPGVSGTIGAGTTPGAAPGAAGTAAAAPGANSFEGFNTQRAQNPTVSAKDAFYAAASAAPRAPDTSKEASAAWFKQYIQPAFEKYGHKVVGVTGDQFTFISPEGQFTVDYHRGAGAPGSALAWQVQGANGASGGAPQPVLDAQGKPVMGPDGKPLMKPAAGGVGGAAGGYTGGDAQGAFQALKSSTSPNAPKEQMEAAIRAHFANVPGFSEAYKESAKINGVWYDMVLSYGSPNAQWTSGLSPKG